MRVGFVGWRGMVGSVLLERMRSEGDFELGFEAEFYTTSQVGLPGPVVGTDAAPLKDAHDLDALFALDAVVSCQGSDYTRRVVPALRERGWKGYWIDAASALRMQRDTAIVLDPINAAVIDQAIASGVRTFAGGNCTVSLMLMAFGALFQQGWVEWMTSMTYQAASGAGARHVRELVAQMRAVGAAASDLLDDPATQVLDLERRVASTLAAPDCPTECFGAPLAASVLPWIDCAMEAGETREEWKGYAETQKILGLDETIPIDGICVRVGAMRCHSQAVTIKLTKDIPIDEIEAAIAEAHPWARVVDNTQEATLRELTPIAVAGQLTVPVGRIRKLRIGPQYLGAFTVGDQLLWGAAEPLRRMLRLLIDGRLL